MPQFDLRGMKIAQYASANGAVTYTGVQTCGEAMTANLEMRFAEGRLYAESTLAEYMRKAIGGTISVGVKYIPDAAQQVMFGSATKSRTIGQTAISGLVMGGKSTGKYVGFACYSPDMVDGVEKYTCIFAKKCLFGPPSYTLQTAGESITFNTPTTSGEFLADDTADKEILEVATVDTEANAIAWVNTVLGGS